MTNKLIEEASNKIWNAGAKLTHNQIDDILTTLLNKQLTELEKAASDIDFYGWDENNQRMIKEKFLTLIAKQNELLANDNN